MTKILRDTYKYKVLLNGKTILIGTTYDLHRRECEHQAEWPGCNIKQIGPKVSQQEAEEWEVRQGKHSKEALNA